MTCAPPCCREDWLSWPRCWCWRREVGGGHSTSCWGGLSRTRCPGQTGQTRSHNSPASSPAQWDLKQRNISVCGWVWLIRLLWRVLISHYWGSVCEKSLLNEDGQSIVWGGYRELCNTTTVKSAQLCQPAPPLLPRWQWRLCPENADELKVMMFTWDFSFSLSLLFLSKHCSSSLQ